MVANWAISRGLRLHEEPVVAVFSRCADLVTVDNRGLLAVWQWHDETDSFELSKSFSVGRVVHHACMLDGFLAILSEGSIFRVDIATEACMPVADGLCPLPTARLLQHRETFLVPGRDEGTLMHGKQKLVLAEGVGIVVDCCIVEDRLFALRECGTVCVYDLASSRSLPALKASTGGPLCVTATAESVFVGTASGHVESMATAKIVLSFDEPVTRVHAQESFLFVTAGMKTRVYDGLTLVDSLDYTPASTISPLAYNIGQSFIAIGCTHGLICLLSSPAD